jgi:hypothetical protein
MNKINLILKTQGSNVPLAELCANIHYKSGIIFLIFNLKVSFFNVIAVFVFIMADRKLGNRDANIQFCLLAHILLYNTPKHMLSSAKGDLLCLFHFSFCNNYRFTRRCMAVCVPLNQLYPIVTSYKITGQCQNQGFDLGTIYVIVPLSHVILSHIDLCNH